MTIGDVKDVLIVLYLLLFNIFYFNNPFPKGWKIIVAVFSCSMAVSILLSLMFASKMRVLVIVLDGFCVLLLVLGFQLYGSPFGVGSETNRKQK